MAVLRPDRLFAALTLILVIGIFSVLAGSDYSFTLIYLVPIVFAAVDGLLPGVTAAGLAFVMQFGVDLLWHRALEAPLVWNDLSRFAIYVAAAVAIDRLHGAQPSAIDGR